MIILTFIRKAQGTLAPWSPTKKHIVGGMYSYSAKVSSSVRVLLGRL